MSSDPATHLFHRNMNKHNATTSIHKQDFPTKATLKLLAC